MKQARPRSIMFVMTILTVLALSTLQVVPVLADDEAPPPPAATEVAPPAEGNPSPEVPPAEMPTQVPVTNMEEAPQAEQAPVVEEPPSEPEVSETPAEILAQVPENTNVVVLDESGEALPLASQKAAEIITSGDPQWCPVGVTPGAASCSGPKDSLNGSNPDTDLIQWLIDHHPSVAGVIWIQGSILPGGYTGNIATEGGAITLDGSILTSMSNYALTLKGGWTGTGTIINSNTPSVFNVSLNITNWNGNITLSDIEIANASGSYGLDISTTKDISLTRVKVHGIASGSGAYLDNTIPGGTGKVSITSSDFYQNGGSYGLYVRSNGAITLTNVTANQNTSTVGGIYVTNQGSSLAPGITLNGVTTTGNRFNGLLASSKGLISGRDLTSSSNGTPLSPGGGAVFENLSGTAGVTLAGTNLFNENYATGLSINSHGAILLNNVIANANDGSGYGAYLNNGEAATAQPITLTGSNEFKYNKDTGLNIETKGLVTLNNVNASGSITGSGVSIDTSQWNAMLSIYTGSPLGGLKLTGKNIFNDNYDSGIIVDSVGALTLNNVTANGNLNGYGVYLANNVAATAKPVTLTGSSTANGNYNSGIFVKSKGLITAGNLIASNNSSGSGAVLDNSDGSGAAVTLTGANFFSGNNNYGLNIYSRGAITVSNITSTGNAMVMGNYGVYLNNHLGAAKPVTVNGTSEFSNNSGIGLYISSTGAVKLNNITASSNTGAGSYGAHVTTTYNNASLAAVTLTGTNRFDSNNETGLYVNTPGIVTLNNLNASGNGNMGANIDNTSAAPSAPRNVSLTGSSTFSYNTFTGLSIASFGAITASNLTATGNGTSSSFASGAYLDNCIYNGVTCTALTPKAVTLTGTNVFTSNTSDGLYIYSLGAITASNLTANNNGNGIDVGAGANLTHAGGAVGAITLSGTNTFNYNTRDGLYVYALGAITISNLKASNNGRLSSDNGVELRNSGASNGPVTLTGSVVANSNFYSGLYVDTTGKITIANLSASYNQNRHGADLYNAYGGSSASVTLTGTSVFNGNHFNGLGVTSYGAINILTTSLTANDNGVTPLPGIGLFLDNSSASTPQQIKLTGTNVFNGNYYGGVTITSKGAITTSNLTANNTSHGQGASISSSGASGVITLTGTNNFNNNFNAGLGVGGSVKIVLNNVTANENGLAGSSGTGVYIDNSSPGATGAVTLTGTNTFNGNYSDGLTVNSLGAVTINNLTASYTTHGGGLYISNNTAVNSGVTLTGFTKTNENYSYGTYILSHGNVSLTKLTADGNGGDGVSGGVSVSTTGNITLTCASLTSNAGNGAYLSAPLATLKGVFASGNGGLNINSSTPPVIIRSCPLP